MAKHHAITPGSIFGKLTVVSSAGRIKGHYCWNCLCVCGRSKPIRDHHLADGMVRSCGNVGCKFPSVVTHGHAGTAGRIPEYWLWKNIKQRCHNPEHRNYADYGGRGITVCNEWRGSFPAFLEYVGRRPSPMHSLDRWPNNDGNYEPGNVRWATDTQQAQNTRANVIIEYKGTRMVQCEWERKFGLSDGTIHQRLLAGWSVERAITQPPRKFRNA